MTAQKQQSVGQGFPAPVVDAQKSFRCLLTAMSEPGTVQSFDSVAEVPRGLSLAATIIFLTLADPDTPVWLDAGIDSAAGAYIRFHCGAPIVERPCEAMIAVVDAARRSVSLSEFNAGVDQFPDRSATVVVQCAALTNGPTIAIEGPGINGTRTISPQGLPAHFWADVRANNSRYPMGVDLLIVAEKGIMAIPRSTIIHEDGGR